MTINSKDWRSWEVDPSTRQSVHVWNKYQPVDGTLSTAGTAENLLSITRIEPAVNLVTNPSIEVNTLTMYTASGSAISQSSAQAATGSYSLLVNPANSAAGEGVYWASGSLIGHAQSSYLIAQCEVRGASASGDVRIEIQNSTGTAVATGATTNLSTGWQRLTVAYQLPVNSTATYRVSVNSVAQHNINFYIDKFMVETRNESTASQYVDGAQGLNYEWTGAENASVSKRRQGLSSVRGFSLHATRDTYLAFDHTASSSTGVFIRAGTDWASDFPIDIQSNISFVNVNANETPRIYGVVFGTHGGENP